MWPMINDVETGKSEHYPHLQPQTFEQPPAQVVPVARAVAEAMPRWTKVSEADGVIRAVAVTKVLRFKDDITIRVAPDGNGSVVSMRGKSRLGKGDLGQNARWIAAFQKELAAAMRRG
jgi:uncharacterized protein (DUF1499 family)